MDAVVIGAENSHAWAFCWVDSSNARGAGLSGYRQRRKPIKTRRFAEIRSTRRGLACAIDLPFPMYIWHRVSFSGRLWDFVVARLLMWMAIWICGVLLAPLPGFAQSNQENGCLPWEEFRDGACVAKPG